MPLSAMPVMECGLWTCGYKLQTSGALCSVTAWEEKGEKEPTVEVKTSYADVVRGTRRVSSDVADAVRQRKVECSKRQTRMSGENLSFLSLQTEINKESL